MEVPGCQSGSLVYRWARHFQTGVDVVAVVSAVSIRNINIGL